MIQHTYILHMDIYTSISDVTEICLPVPTSSLQPPPLASSLDQPSFTYDPGGCPEKSPSPVAPFIFIFIFISSCPTVSAVRMQLN